MKLLNFLIITGMLLGAFFMHSHQYDHAQCCFGLSGILQMTLMEKRLKALNRQVAVLQRVMK